MTADQWKTRSPDDEWGRYLCGSHLRECGNTVSTSKIVTHHWPKPIPINGFDWSAVLDDYDGAPDAGFQPVGYGATEQEAIDDLLEQLDDRALEKALSGRSVGAFVR